MIECKEISASYREIHILRDINLLVQPGDFLGIIGQNGAGKTTLLKVLTGVKQPAAGSIVLDGKNMEQLSRREIATIMAVVPQSTFVPPLFTVEDVVGIGRYARRQNRFSESKADRSAIEDALQKTDSIRFRDRLISELSGGERQEVLIARALAQEPKILLLDEPTANLDIKHQIKIMDLIKQLIKKGGFTAIIVIHDINLAARFCNRLMLLHEGGILATGTPSEVLTPANLATAYDVSAAVEYNMAVQAPQVTTIECLNTPAVIQTEVSCV